MKAISLMVRSLRYREMNNQHQNTTVVVDQFKARIVNTKYVLNNVFEGFTMDLEKQDGTIINVTSVSKHSDIRKILILGVAASKLRKQLGKRLVSEDLTEFFDTEKFYNVELDIVEKEFYNSKHDELVNRFSIK